MDKLMETVFYREQRKDEPPRADAPNGLEEPTGDLEERGGYEGHVAESSLYTSLRQRREAPRSLAVGIGLAATAAYAGYRRLRRDDDASGDGGKAEDRRLETRVKP